MILLLNKAVRRTYFAAGGVGPYTCNRICKNGGGFSPPSLGTCTDQGNSTVSIDFDVNDTDTVGDLVLYVTDSIAQTFIFDYDEVWDSPIGYLPNNSTSKINLLQLNLQNSGAAALTITNLAAGAPAIQVTSADQGMNITAAQEGVSINAATGFFSVKMSGDSGLGIFSVNGPGVHVQSTAGNAIELTASAGKGMLLTADVGISIVSAHHSVLSTSTSGPGWQITGQSDAVKLTGTTAAGLRAEGNTIGVGARRTSGAPPALANGGLSIASALTAINCISSGGDAAIVQGNTFGLRLVGAANQALSLNGVNVAEVIANFLLDLVNGIETGYTPRQFFRAVFSVLGGKSFLTGNTRRFRDVNDTVDRVTATTDTQGQRTNVTLNL